MDGLLIVDKPSGPTSHDVVARMRRALRETRIGHTGTLDPMATGVLLLVVGKATRLAKFLSASDKSYDAVVRFGFATDTADAQGQPLGPVSDRAMPSREAIDAALDAFRGTFMQQPPAFSAKKIDGQRSYKLARAARRSRRAPSLRPRTAAPTCTCHRPTRPPCPRQRHHARPRDPGDRGRHGDAQRGLLRRLLHPIAGARPRASGSASARIWRRCGGRGSATSVSIGRLRSTRRSATRACR